MASLDLYHTAEQYPTFGITEDNIRDHGIGYKSSLEWPGMLLLQFKILRIISFDVWRLNKLKTCGGLLISQQYPVVWFVVVHQQKSVKAKYKLVLLQALLLAYSLCSFSLSGGRAGTLTALIQAAIQPKVISMLLPDHQYFITSTCKPTAHKATANKLERGSLNLDFAIFKQFSYHFLSRFKLRNF